MAAYQKVIINCLTNDSIPPPYAHFYRIEVNENPSYLTMSFEQKYTDREDLTEEEILDEGFSMDDDFSWKGSLNKIWKKQLEYLLDATRLNPHASTTSDYLIEITIQDQGNETKGFVSKKETQRWAYLIQELKQAVLESEKIEAPLQMEYHSIGDGRETVVQLNGSFADRTFTVRVDNRPVEQLDWEVLQKTIDLIFNETEINQEESKSKRPSAPGNYLMIPGSGWFEIGTGIKARYNDPSIVNNILKTLRGFAGLA